MSNILSHLQPQSLWTYFEDICQIPRPSKREEKMLKYLIGFANKHHLAYAQDKVGNLVIRKDASAGYEGVASVVLQSHIDMVCEKNAETVHDFDNDPIQPYIEDGWVKARGTTLGADDGIGVAAQLAILSSDTIEHGPLECLFTVDEETGMTGAFGLEPGFLKSKTLLNLDSEDDGELFIGCAGGVGTEIVFPYQKVSTEPGHRAFKVAVSGLAGGHSGDDINKNRGNAIKILNRILWQLEKNCELRLAEIDGGNLRNAIPREAHVHITVPERFVDALHVGFDALIIQVTKEWKTSEPRLTISLDEAIMPDGLIDYATQSKLLNGLYACPHGVLSMSADMPGLVETSTNLASVKTNPGEILIATSQRSSIDSSLRDAANMVSSVFLLAGASVNTGDAYPGWKPNVNSRILGVMRNSYQKLFGAAPKVLAIHAGLECGLIGEKYPDMDMISYGPTMRGAHSPDERLEISTVQKFWDLTLDVLRNVG
jgi:dipeptidase D